MPFSIIFPGQGSQSIGMMSELATQHPLVKDLFTEASDTLKVDMWAMTQEGPIESLSQTENTQPALLIAGVAAWRVWQELGGINPAIMAGHSLGEYTALVAAGALSFADGVALVREVIQVCAEVAGDDVLQAVNFNAPGQVVIAGSAAAIERAALAMKEAGAKRALPLPVSIPAHSSLMSPASARLAERLSSVEVSVPSILTRQMGRVNRIYAPTRRGLFHRKRSREGVMRYG